MVANGCDGPRLLSNTLAGTGTGYTTSIDSMKFAIFSHNRKLKPYNRQVLQGNAFVAFVRASVTESAASCSAYAE